jgi:HSP20 family protein
LARTLHLSCFETWSDCQGDSRRKVEKRKPFVEDPTMKMIFPDARFNRSMGEWASDMNALVDSLFGASAASGGSGGSSFSPRMDIREVDDRYVLAVDLPGVKQDDVQIELEGDYLVISGTRQWTSDSEGERYHRVERTFGEFRRSVRLPRDVQREQIAADYTDGVLSIELPKSKPTSAQKIRIRTQGSAGESGHEPAAEQAQAE